MADKDMVDFMNRNLVPTQLHLSTFATINEKMPVLNGKVL